MQMFLHMFLMIPDGYTDFEHEQYVDVHREFRNVVCYINSDSVPKEIGFRILLEVCTHPNHKRECLLCF